MNSTAASDPVAPASLQQWLAQGELLHATLLREQQHLEAQLLDLEKRLADKQAEVNQVCRLLGKPATESRRLSAQIVNHYVSDIPTATTAGIARALTGGKPAATRVAVGLPRPPAAEAL